MALAVASAWCGLHHAPTFAAKRAALFGRSFSDLLVVTDFDLTLTCGTSLQCHDVLGTGRCMPAGARADFAELLDFSRPFPAHLEREAWWTRANEILLSHNAPLRHQLPHLVAEAGMALRPGALELLAKLAQLDVPVLIVSAGCADLIEHFLEAHGALSPNVRVASNRLLWDDQSGALVGCAPLPPVTSFCKHQTHARNADFFRMHAARQTLLLIGDKKSDLQVAEGVPHSLSLAIGLYNVHTTDSPAPTATAATTAAATATAATATAATVTATAATVAADIASIATATPDDDDVPADLAAAPILAGLAATAAGDLASLAGMTELAQLANIADLAALAAAAGARAHPDADGSLASYLSSFDAVAIGHAAPLHPLVSLLDQWEGHERRRGGGQPGQAEGEPVGNPSMHGATTSQRTRPLDFDVAKSA